MGSLSLRCEEDPGFTYGPSPLSTDHWYLFLFDSIFSLVVEADHPYRDEQIAQYGESFKTWTEDEFSNTIGSLTAALAFGSFAMIVSFI